MMLHYHHSGLMLKIYLLVDIEKIGGIDINPGTSYTYKVPKLDLLGKEAFRNVLRMDFTLTDFDGNEYHKYYEYNYAVLTECSSDAQCSDKYECDRENVAGFSDDRTTYCVRSCGVHTECEDGQICRLGRCGY